MEQSVITLFVNHQLKNGSCCKVDLQQFFIEFQDYLAPTLDTYEQAIYLYVFRHSRLIGKQEVTIGFKSERTRLACGIGEHGTAMSEGSVYKKISSLQQKGAIRVLRTTHSGRELAVVVPSEIPGLIPDEEEARSLNLEEMDFFNVAENRLLILERENFRCFYTLQKLDASNFVVEHVVSRPAGDNSYRNCVAASREANNKKGKTSAEDFLRRLFRDGFLNETEFHGRLKSLQDLKEGILKPTLKRH